VEPLIIFGATMSSDRLKINRRKLMEECILDCIISSQGKAYFDLPVGFDSKYFFGKNREFFEELERHILEKKPIDEALALLLKGGHRPDIILASCCELAVPANIAYYAKELMKIHRFEELKRHLRVALEMTDRDYSLEEVISFLMDQEEVKTTLKSIIPPTLNEEIKRIKESSNYEPIKTGFQVIDRHLFLRGGNLFVLAGLTSVGKSTLALNIAQNIAKAGYSVLYNSYELTSFELASKVLSSETRHTVDYLLENPVSKDLDFGGRVYLNSEIHELSKVLLISRKLASMTNLKLIIIDYLQLASPKMKSATRSQEIGFTCRKFGMLAKELGCLVLLISQLSREAEKEEDKRPKLRHLRESGEIENHADVVLFMHPYEGDIVELYLAKVRLGKGRGQSLYLKADFKHSRFIDKTMEKT